MKYVHLLLFVMLSLSSCEWIIDSIINGEEDTCDEYSYSDCETEKPLTAPLKIDLTINEENPKIPLVVLDGKLEDSDTLLLDTAQTEYHEIEVDPDRFYTVTARYKSGNKTIIAVDGDKINLQSYTHCDSTCWELRGGHINLRLKF